MNQIEHQITNKTLTSSLDSLYKISQIAKDEKSLQILHKAFKAICMFIPLEKVLKNHKDSKILTNLSKLLQIIQELVNQDDLNEDNMNDYDDITLMNYYSNQKQLLFNNEDIEKIMKIYEKSLNTTIVGYMNYSSGEPIPTINDILDTNPTYKIIQHNNKLINKDNDHYMSKFIDIKDFKDIFDI